MNSREQNFENLKNDHWYGPLIVKLKSKGQQTCLEFIRTHGELDIGAWEKAVQRLFLDKGDDKPKNWTLINEILIVCGKAPSK